MKKQWPFWVGLTAIILVFIYLVKAILLPFVVGIMVAYFFDPLADRLERMRFARGLAAFSIVLSFFAVIFAGLTFLMPLLYHQLEALIFALPRLVSEHQQLLPEANAWLQRLDHDFTHKLDETVKNASLTILGYLADILTDLMQSGIALINLLSLIFITPVVAFYFLRDWDRMVAKIHSFLPRRHAETIRMQLGLIDNAISGFVRGQTQVCLLLGLFYMIGLSLIGLEGGILIGFFTGMATFIPYVGMWSGTAVGLIVAWLQFGQWEGVATVALVFLVGQIIESNFIAPKLVGHKVGLHPVWIIFGMLAGGKLFGLLGVIVAVPVTAVIGVLVRFLTALYLKSAYFKK